MTSNWKRFEKSKAREHRGKHVGGSGKPDYVRGDVLGEVKCWNKPLTKNQVMVIARKGVTEIVSKGGFTKSALEYAEQYRPNLKLFSRGRHRN